MTPEKIQQWREEYLEFRKANIAGHLECYLAARSKAQEEIDSCKYEFADELNIKCNEISKLKAEVEELKDKLHDSNSFIKNKGSWYKQQLKERDELITEARSIAGEIASGEETAWTINYRLEKWLEKTKGIVSQADF